MRLTCLAVYVSLLSGIGVMATAGGDIGTLLESINVWRRMPRCWMNRSWKTEEAGWSI